MAARTSIVKKLPDEYRPQSVDGWLYWSCVNAHKPDKWIVRYNESDSWQYGVDIHGLDNISISRHNEFSEVMRIYSKSDKRLDDILPLGIADAIKALRPQLRKHEDYRPWLKGSFYVDN